MKTAQKIKSMAEDVYKKILKKKQPSMTFPLRALSNVKYDPKADCPKIKKFLTSLFI